MRFTVWKEEIPGRIYNRMGKLEAELREFMAMDVKTVKVVYTAHEYKRYKTCYEALYRTVKRLGLPIQVVTRDKEIFLIRKDI